MSAMAQETTPPNSLTRLVETIVESYRIDTRNQHLDSTFLPNRERTIQTLELTRRILFPGFFDETRLTTETIRYHVGDLVSRLHGLL